MKSIRIVLMMLTLSLFAGADSQKLWSGSVGPMFTVNLALGDGSATLTLSETAKSGNNSMAVGNYLLTKHSLEIDVKEIRFGGKGAEKKGAGFVIETPRKGKDGVPTLKVTPGAKLRFTAVESGDRLELKNSGGVELVMYLKK